MLTAVSWAASVVDMVVSRVKKSCNCESYNTYLCKKRDSPGTNRIQRIDESPELFLGQQREPFFHLGLARVENLIDQLQPFGGNSSRNVPPMLLIPHSSDQLGLFQPLEQPRDVRHLGDHPLSNLSAAETVAPGTSEDPQHVELRAGDAILPQCFVVGVVYHRRCSKEPKQRLVL